MRMQVTPLGAGQDVGRSCILLTMGGKNIMLDCGVHAGYNDERRFPDFSYISKTKDYTGKLDCVLISHFHSDHCGALPYFTEIEGYNGPIFMTHPTKAICPILMEDFRRVSVEKKGLRDTYSSEDIKNCMKKVTTLNLKQTLVVEKGFEITSYYAGHVLGAVMFHIRVGDLSAVYTGDYNMTPDRHLGSAWIDKLKPDVLITESTYATMIRESKRTRERALLKNIHYCVTNGGKVLIPVFALGRAQELFILIETYWDRMGLSNVPIYFQAGLTMKANDYYKLFINWTNQKIKDTFVQRNMFDYKYIKPYDRSYLETPGPMVIFATPAMLNAGASLDILKRLAPDPKNMVLMPGFCEANTIGAKVLAGHTVIDLDSNTKLHVNLQVKLLSFSAHADAKGIMQMIRQVEPKHVILVHGEKSRMNILRSRVMGELGIPCFDPANGTTVKIQCSQAIPIEISQALLEATLLDASDKLPTLDGASTSLKSMVPSREIPIKGVLVMKSANQAIRFLTAREAASQCEPPIEAQELFYQYNIRFNSFILQAKFKPLVAKFPSFSALALHLIHLAVKHHLQNPSRLETGPGHVRFRSVEFLIPPPQEEDSHVIMNWAYVDEDMAANLLSVAKAALR
ncbi:hypothetical protein DSO57_1027909 [Entomophthora muscae]|nr:hypothetical protein DSO57_1027909 [Entomophthora muscae]